MLHISPVISYDISEVACVCVCVSVCLCVCTYAYLCANTWFLDAFEAAQEKGTVLEKSPVFCHES